MNKEYDVLIIGSGPAGLSAGLYTSRSGRKTIIITGDVLGGQLSIIPELENYPGIRGSISGFDLVDIMKSQVESFGCEIKMDKVKTFSKSDNQYSVELTSGDIIKTKSIIIASGASSRKLGAKGEEEYFGKGVSYCAVCDGFFNKGKHVAFVGGGNSALVEALYMSKLATDVTIIYRKDSFFRGEKVTVDKIYNTPNIKLIFNSTVEEICGDGNSIKSLRLKNIKTNEITNISMDSIFIAIGHNPANDFLPNWIDLDSEGYIITENNKMKIKDEGIFIAGDVRSSSKHQVAIAVGNGASAGMECDDYLGLL